MAIGSTLSVGLIGLKAFIVQVQAFISPGLPYFSIIGLPDASLSEARERVKSACQATGFGWPQTRVTVNMSPAAMPKRGSSHDLAIAASVLCAAGAIGHDCLEDTIVLGEVNLDGSVLPIHGLLPIMLHAEERGVRKMIVPHRNLDEASMVDGLDVVGVRHVGELIELMGGDATYTIPDTPVADETTTDQSPTSHPNDCGDMNEVLGQEHAKWALQVAAAGGHNLIMTGPPGSGKTMLASRMPGIMCPLNEAEQLEVASIRSLCGILPQYGITDMPPFEAPAPHRQHGGLGGWWQRHRRSRRDHARASRHSVSGRGTGIQRTRPADVARTIGIRVCGAFPFKRQHLLPGLIPTHHGGQPLPVRILLRHRRTLRLPGKRPYSLFLAIVRTDIGSCGYSDGGATGLAHCRAERDDRRVQCRDTSSCDSRPSSGQGPVQTVRMGVQRASFGQMAARQYVAESDGIGQSGPVQSSTHIARG